MKAQEKKRLGLPHSLMNETVSHRLHCLQVLLATISRLNLGYDCVICTNLHAKIMLHNLPSIRMNPIIILIPQNDQQARS